MVTRKWFKFGTGAAIGVTTIVALFSFLITNYGFVITGTDDLCAGTKNDPCLSYLNVSNNNIFHVDVYNQNEIKLKFSPEIPEYYLFRKDGRCRGGVSCAAPNGVSLHGWNFIDFTNATKPVADKVYVFRFPARETKEFLLWGLKNSPHEKVKWSFTTEKGELDPIWKGNVLDNVKVRYIYSYFKNETCIYHLGNNSYDSCEQINSTTVVEYTENLDKSISVKYYEGDK